MKESMKASEVYKNSKTFFPKTSSFSDIFPEIKSFTFKVEQESFRNKRAETIKSYYDLKNPPGPYIDCDNPRCYNGGFSIDKILKYMVIKKEKEDKGIEPCQGYEGSYKGRRKYGECLNQFSYKINIEYID